MPCRANFQKNKSKDASFSNITKLLEGREGNSIKKKSGHKKERMNGGKIKENKKGGGRGKERENKKFLNYFALNALLIGHPFTTLP